MPLPASQAPTQDRSRKTREELIDALERLLSDKSIGELTVAEIASEAGMTTGAIYRRFKDKQDLLRAAFDRFLEKTEQSSSRLATEAGALSDRELLRMVIESTLKFTRDHIPIMRAASSLNDLPSFERMSKARQRIADEISELLGSSSLPHGELNRRIRFTLRVVTAVGRDTFLAGPGATQATSETDKELGMGKKAMDQLVNDLFDTSASYLEI